MGQVVSGILTAVNGESTVERFKIRRFAPSPAHAGSNLAGAVFRRPGNVDWRGYYAGAGHTPVLAFPGEDFTFRGKTDTLKGVEGSAICDRLTITAPVEAGDLIHYRVDFSADGALSFGAIDAVSDTTDVMAYSSVDRKIAIDGADAEHVRQWRLMIQAYNRAYNSSETGKQTIRNAGNIDASWFYQAYFSDPANIPAEDTIAQIRFYVEAAAYWEFNWGYIEVVDDFGGDRLAIENIGATIAGRFTGNYGTITGSITDPAGNTKWP